MGRLHWGAWVIAVAASLVACDFDQFRDFVDRQPCVSTSDCRGGWTCDNNQCAKSCNSSPDCPSLDQACVAGICNVIARAECASNSDCDTPGQCSVPGSVGFCFEGRCEYPPLSGNPPCDDNSMCTSGDVCDDLGNCIGIRVLCDSPDPDECLNDDTVFRDFDDIGFCDPPTGNCIYQSVEMSCPNCRTQCLGVCTGFPCPDQASGCLINGRCLPTDPAQCVYEDAPRDTRCDLAADPPGSNRGYCIEGACVGCDEAADCTTPPTGDVTCKTPACNGGDCAYTDATGVCAVEQCMGDALQHERSCANGTCMDAGSTDCSPYTCANSVCLGACSSHVDCAAGHYCTAMGTCVPKLNDGGDCSSDGPAACSSNYCEGGICCFGFTAPECCVGDMDCSGFGAAAQCANPTPGTDCQGRRDVTSCSGNVCVTSQIDDDSACDAPLERQCPGRFADILCDGTMAQMPAVCPTSCANDPQCRSPFVCNTMTGQCEDPPGNLGDACPPPCSGSVCVGGLCCDSICDTTCWSCEGALTDMTFGDGFCQPILANLTDTTGTQCAGATGCPGGVACACDGAGTCLNMEGALCNQGTECISGFCACADADCTTSICSASDCGECTWSSDGSACDGDVNTSVGCDDLDNCTTADFCDQGSCTSLTPVDCSDGDICTDDVCDPGTGMCTNPPTVIPDVECGNRFCMNDGYRKRICLGGGCNGDQLVMECDDGEDCTTDSCNTGGCLNQPRMGACDDQIACTQMDTCNNGECVGVPMNSLCPPDALPCTDEVCTAVGCLSINSPPTTVCDDGVDCTHTDRCNAGSCGGTPIVCNDDPGTCSANRSCNGSPNCSVTFPMGNTCAGFDCTGSGTCNGSGSCIGGQPLTGSCCEYDGSFENGVCDSGECVSLCQESECYESGEHCNEPDDCSYCGGGPN